MKRKGNKYMKKKRRKRKRKRKRDEEIRKSKIRRNGETRNQI